MPATAGFAARLRSSQTLPPDKTNAIASIERALSEKGIEVVQDGPHFVRIFRKETRDSLTNAPLRGAELAVSKGPATNAPFPGAAAHGAKGQETMPQGMIDFSRADLNQVLFVYAAMRQRTILRPATLPAPVISLKVQRGLSPEEAAYAVATVLALNGICVVDDGARFVQVVPMAQRAQVKTGAPDPEARAGVMPAGAIDLSGAELNQVLSLYSAMRQRTVLRAGNPSRSHDHLQDAVSAEPGGGRLCDGESLRAQWHLPGGRWPEARAGSADGAAVGGAGPRPQAGAGRKAV